MAKYPDPFTRSTLGRSLKRHAAKRDYPDEALCGRQLDPQKNVRNIRDRQRCNNCVNVYAGGGR